MSIKLIAAVAAVIALGSIGCAAPCTHVAQPISFTAERPVTLRIEAGTMWTSANPVAEVRRAWTMPAHGPVEALTVTALVEGGYLVTFRQGGVAWRGELDTDRAARGLLAAVPESIQPANPDLATAQR